MLKLCGLWIRKGSNGEEIIQGELTPTTRIVILPNTFKNKPQHPDYNFYVVPKEG